MSNQTANKSAFSNAIDEKLFRLLIASVEDCAIFVIDQNGYIMSWNQGAEHIKGYREEEIIGKHISIFYTPDDIRNNEPRNNLNSALKNGSHEIEGWRLRKDGSAFWANVVFTTLYNDEGHLIGFAKVTRDITERKKAEDKKEEINVKLEKKVKENTEKIVANELRFRKLIESSYDGIALLNHNLDVFYRSLSAERINGWSDKEIGSYGMIDLVHPDDKELVKDLIASVLNTTGIPLKSTYRTRHKLGHYMWTEYIFTNWLTDSNINAIVCNFRDVTESITANEEIRKKTQQIENILESITDGFIALDENLCYTYANRVIGKMLECEPQSLIGRYVWSVFPDAVDSETAKAFNKVLSKKQYICNVDYYEPLDLWQENHIYPSAGGGLSVFIRNVSERKKSELEIKNLNESLEKKVIERTLQLEAVNKELEAFSYSVSHDLRTPLRAVNGYAMMLREDFENKLGAEGERVINIIINNASLMGKLIDDLLAFSRLGRKEIATYQVDMYQLVKTCVRELLEHDTKKVRVKINEDLPPCHADGSMLKQVWMNLVGNAIKYSSKNDAPFIEIGFIDNEDTITYFIKDNGVGFDMQYAGKLFGVFQRLHRNDEFNGTGVGLALVKRIVERHDGKIWAEASPGKGAVFYFSLPKK